MFPFIFEWEWDIAHMLFMGATGFAVSIIGAGLTYCILKTIYDTATGDGGDSGHH